MRAQQLVDQNFDHHEQIRIKLVDFFGDLSRDELILIKKYKIHVDDECGYKSKSSGVLCKMLRNITDLQFNRSFLRPRSGLLFSGAFINMRFRAPYNSAGWLLVTCAALDSKKGRSEYFRWLEEKVMEAIEIKERAERRELKRLLAKYPAA